MSKIRVIIEDSEPIEYEYNGEVQHYIEINTAHYGIEQISQNTEDAIVDWGEENNIGMGSFKNLVNIMKHIEVV